MKRRYLWAVLLILVALLASSCTNENPEGVQTAETGGVEATQAPVTGDEDPDNSDKELDIDGNSQAKDERPEPGELPAHLSYRQTAGEQELMQADFGDPDSDSAQP